MQGDNTFSQGMYKKITDYADSLSRTTLNKISTPVVKAPRTTPDFKNFLQTFMTNYLHDKSAQYKKKYGLTRDDFKQLGEVGQVNVLYRAAVSLNKEKEELTERLDVVKLKFKECTGENSRYQSEITKLEQSIINKDALIENVNQRLAVSDQQIEKRIQQQIEKRMETFVEKTNLLWKRKFSDVVSRARAPADDESSEDEEMKDKSSEDEEIPRRRKRIKLLEETQDKPKSNVEMVGTSTSSDSKEDTDEKMPTNNALMLRDSGVSSVSVTSNTFTLMGFIRSENFKTYMDKKLQDFSGEALSQVEVKSTGQTVPQKYSHYSFIVVAFNNNKKRSRQAQAPRMDANRPWKLAALKETNQIEHIFSNAKEQQELTAAVFAAFRYALEYDLKQIKSIEGDRLRSYKRSRSDFENDEVTMTYSGQSALDNTDVVLIDHDIQSTGIRLHVVIPGQELSRTEENNIAMLYAKFIKVIIDEMAKAQCDGCEKLSEYGVNVSFEPAILNMS